MSKPFACGETVPAFEIPVLADREARTAAGIRFLFARLVFMNAGLLRTVRHLPDGSECVMLRARAGELVAESSLADQPRFKHLQHYDGWHKCHINQTYLQFEGK